LIGEIPVHISSEFYIPTNDAFKGSFGMVIALLVAPEGSRRTSFEPKETTMQTKWIAIALMSAALPAGQALAAQDAGDRSFTISGTGASDKDFNATTFGTTAQLGWFLSDPVEVGLRQSYNIFTADNANDAWNGSTAAYLDWNFGKATLVPFLGANIGGIYGDGVKDTGTAGLEGGLKWYVKDKTFIDFAVQYQFLFDNADDIDNRFDDGAYFYSLGVGFNF